MNKIYNIYDKVAKTYTMPLVFTNDDSAKRYFTTQFIDNPNKNDYDLYYLGDYDTELGQIIIDKDNDAVLIGCIGDKNCLTINGILIYKGSEITYVKEL